MYIIILAHWNSLSGFGNCFLEHEADAGDSCLDVCGECYGTDKKNAREQAMINVILKKLTSQSLCC